MDERNTETMCEAFLLQVSFVRTLIFIVFTKKNRLHHFQVVKQSMDAEESVIHLVHLLEQIYPIVQCQ